MDEERLNPLLEIFNLEKKRDIEKHCRTAEATSSDLVNLILAGRAGVLTPYLYQAHFFDAIPDDVKPTDEELNSLNDLKSGDRLTGKAASFFRKIDQTSVVRRLFAAHLFYTPSHRHWYLFYFDQRDTEEQNNHWAGGSHIHLVTDHTNLKLKDVWAQVGRGDMRFPKFHIRFKNST